MLAWNFVSTAQDTARTFNHEIGFNAVSLLQQIRVFSVTPGGQLPYDAFYNLYFKDKIGLRAGLGILHISTETDVEGQDEPRITKQQRMNLRAGLSYNFVNTKNFAFNFFVDGVLLNSTNETVNSFTFQAFPDPVGTRTVKISEKSSGAGAQAGIGLKWKITKLFCLYTEMPFSFVSTIAEIRDEIQQTGMPVISDNSVSRSTGINFDLPLTVYLVLRF